MELKATKYGVDGGVTTVTLSRPQRMNAWTGRMHAEYRWCIAAAEQDPAEAARVPFPLRTDEQVRKAILAEALLLARINEHGL